MKKHLVILASILLLMGFSQPGCTNRNDIKDQVISNLEANRSTKVSQLQKQLEEYTNELRGLEAGGTNENVDEEQLDRQIEALESRIADVTQQINQMEKLSSAWLNNKDDWQVKKTQKGVYFISGYGLGWATADIVSGKWYYYKMDNTVKPADAPAQKLRNVLATSASKSSQD